MSWLRRADDGVGHIAEHAYRTLSRRAVVRGGLVSGTAGLAALAIGERPAAAATCDCGPTSRCSGCRSTGCPSGYSLCKGSGTSNCFNNQGFRCEWPSGSWVACSGFGACHNGYQLCYDCIGPGGCAHWCTCLSSCICCNCCSPAEVRAEQKRIQEELAAYG
jgi:hypothetical protein